MFVCWFFCRFLHIMDHIAFVALLQLYGRCAYYLCLYHCRVDLAQNCHRVVKHNIKFGPPHKQYMIVVGASTGPIYFCWEITTTYCTVDSWTLHIDGLPQQVVPLFIILQRNPVLYYALASVFYGTELLAYFGMDFYDIIWGRPLFLSSYGGAAR